MCRNMYSVPKYEMCEAWLLSVWRSMTSLMVRERKQNTDRYTICKVRCQVHVVSQDNIHLWQIRSYKY